MITEAFWQDIIASILAFIGLGSLVLCYMDYRLRWFDYFSFVGVFFILGWYASLSPDSDNVYQWATALSYVAGVLLLLWGKSFYLRKKARKLADNGS